MKRIISVLLSCLLAAATIPASAYSSGSYSNGDVDRNSELSISDATLIQKYLVSSVSLDGEQLTLADVNLDGGVNVMDVTKIQKIIAKLDTLPSEPDSSVPSTLESSTSASETIAPTTDSTAQTTETVPATTESTSATTETIIPTTESVTSATQTTATQPVTAPNPKVSNNIKIYFTNNVNWKNVYFYLYNSSTGAELKTWHGTQITNYTTNDYGEKVYSSTVNVDLYDRIIFNDGAGNQTVNIPINKASSGFFISDSGNSGAMLVGTYSVTGNDSGNMTKTYLKYPSGYNKKIWIWTPSDYSANSAEKYRTVYIMDGQNLFDDDHTDGYGGWEVTDAVESMMSNGGRGVIIVGIDNSSGNRDSELTPDIGDVIPSYRNEFSNRTGEQFCDFVVNTVMPYVQSNYNSSTAAVDNCIAGSSSGGLEAFYIGLEHKDRFGQIGALSPAFLLFNSATWQSYLSKYDFTAPDMPRLYIYNGNGDFDNELYPDTVAMYNRLLGYEYDTGKIKLSIEEKAAHNEAYWRIIFPEMLSWCLDI